MTKKGFRLDVQGIRGFAMILVLLAHAEVPFAAGGFVGLDMFFVLSGFLITGLIVQEMEKRRGSFSMAGFWGRRAKRILPHAVFVLMVVAVGSMLLFSVLRRDEVAGDVLAAALYVVNWHFAFEHVDYFAFGSAEVSPVQHYWSLSVEEQFYLGWPLVLMFGAWWARRSSLGLRPALLIVITPIAVLSVAYSIYFTAVNVQEAYFSTLTRVWELALGGMLALALPLGLRIAPKVSAALVIGGLATIVYSTVAWDGATPYPGWRALLPTLATCAIIFAGTAVVASGPIRMLTRAPLQFLGKISYAWYLWHWPVIVFAREIWGPMGPPALLALSVLAFAPAMLGHYAIEEPFRRSRSLGRQPRRALAVGFACTVVAVGAGVALHRSQPTIPTASEALAVGASAFGEETLQVSADAVRPDPREVEEDRGRLYDEDCRSQTDPGTCVYGNPSSMTTVALMGDSHAVQYFPTLERIAKRRDWRLVALARADCTVADVTYQPGCDEWRERALERIEDEQPSLVVLTNGTTSNYRVVVEGERLDRDASQPHLEAGFVRSLKRIRKTGAKVTVIRAQARAPERPAECVAESLRRLDRCAFAVDRPEHRAYPARAARMVGDVHLIDPLPVLCPDGRRCPAVIGNVVVYRDEYHLSATFAKSLSPWLERKLPEPKPPSSHQQPEESPPRLDEDATSD